MLESVKLSVLTDLPFHEPDVLVTVKQELEVPIAMSSFSQTAFRQYVSHLNSAVDPATVEWLSAGSKISPTLSQWKNMPLKDIIVKTLVESSHSECRVCRQYCLSLYLGYSWSPGPNTLWLYVQYINKSASLLVGIDANLVSTGTYYVNIELHAGGYRRYARGVYMYFNWRGSINCNYSYITYTLGNGEQTT